MLRLKPILLRLGKPIIAIVLCMGVSTVNSACFGWYYQPKIPEAMNKFKRKR